MKKNLFYLFALICSMSLFTACSSDDDDNKSAIEQVIDEQLVGTYTGSLNVSMGGQTIGSQNNQNIYLSKSSSADDALKLELKNFSILDLVLNIAVEPCTVSGADGNYAFTGSQDVTVEGMDGSYSVSVTGSISGKNINIAIEVTAGNLKVNATFTGSKN